MSKNLKTRHFMEKSFTIAEVSSFWDGVAGIYDKANLNFKDAHYQRFSEAVKYLDIKPGEKILNVWSRTGNAIPFLREKFPGVEITNMEVSGKFIEIARHKFPQENFLKTDLENLPFQNDLFDAVLSLETLEHTPKPMILLKEFYRVLKPEGALVMSLPPKTAELAQKFSALFLGNHGEGPHQFLPSKTVKKMFRNIGFELIVHKGTLLIPFGPKWLRNFGEKIIGKTKSCFIRELGIRQFYVARK